MRAGVQCHCEALVLNVDHAQFPEGLRHEVKTLLRVGAVGEDLVEGRTEHIRGCIRRE